MQMLRAGHGRHSCRATAIAATEAGALQTCASQTSCFSDVRGPTAELQQQQQQQHQHQLQQQSQPEPAKVVAVAVPTVAPEMDQKYDAQPSTPRRGAVAPAAADLRPAQVTFVCPASFPFSLPWSMRSIFGLLFCCAGVYP